MFNPHRLKTPKNGISSHATVVSLCEIYISFSLLFTNRATLLAYPFIYIRLHVL